MTEPRRSKKITVIITLAFLVSGICFWQFYKYKIANKGIHTLVSKKSKGLYSIHYTHFLVDEITGSLSADSIRINADTAEYNKMADNVKPSTLVNLFIPHFEVAHLSTPKALLAKEISGGEIRIDSPVIELYLTDFLKDTSGYSPGEEIYKQILGNLKSIRIRHIEIAHAKLIIRDYISGNKHFEANDVSILLNDLLIDSVHANDSSRILFSKNIDLNCREIILEGKNKKYKVHLEGLDYASQNNSFAMQRLRVVPALSEIEFAKKALFQKDRFDFNFENLMLTNINRQSLWHKRIEADGLTIGKSSFKIYRDLSYPPDSLQKLVGNFPQQQLMRLPIQLSLKKIILPHSFIEYKEKNAQSHNSGKVQFYNVSASLTNVTNIQSLLTDNSISRVYFRSRFLNKAAVTAKLSLFLKNKEGRFSIDGHMDSLHATNLNVLTQPMALVKIKKGDVASLDFHFIGDNNKTNGQLKILYNGFGMQLIKKDKHDSGYSKKFLTSLIASQIIKKSNPENDKTKIVEVHYERVGHKSIFNMIWKPILQGVKQTIGIK
jgi:hypothetical protein